MKRILILLAVAAVSFTVQTANAAEEPVFVVLEGERLAFDQPPVMIENIVFIPIRGMALEMGAAISWQSGTAFLQKDNISAGLSVGSAVMDVNGQSVSLPAAPVILQDRMLVPMRVVSEVLGCRVSWSGENRTVYISPPEDVHRNYRKEKEILKLVNEIRQVNGLPVFAWDDGLASAARHTAGIWRKIIFLTICPLLASRRLTGWFLPESCTGLPQRISRWGIWSQSRW